MWRKKEKKREKKEKRGIEDVKGGRKKETGLVKGGMEGRGGGGGTKSASGARVSNILFLLALAKPRERYRVLHPVFGISPL